VTAQTSYLSVSDRRLHFGLGGALTADLEIRWPSGVAEAIGNLPADRLITIREGEGVVGSEAFAAAGRGR
jgi:enediyne biosynthesis protein E4